MRITKTLCLTLGLVFLGACTESAKQSDAVTAPTPMTIQGVWIDGYTSDDEMTLLEIKEDGSTYAQIAERDETRTFIGTMVAAEDEITDYAFRAAPIETFFDPKTNEPKMEFWCRFCPEEPADYKLNYFFGAQLAQLYERKDEVEVITEQVLRVVVEYPETLDYEKEILRSKASFDHHIASLVGIWEAPAGTDHPTIEITPLGYVLAHSVKNDETVRVQFAKMRLEEEWREEFDYSPLEMDPTFADGDVHRELIQAIGETYTVLPNLSEDGELQIATEGQFGFRGNVGRFRFLGDDDDRDELPAPLKYKRAE